MNPSPDPIPPLLRLPPELRLHIYDHLSNPSPKSYCFRYPPITSINLRAPPTALMATCRLLRDEILTHYYNNVTFRAVAQSFHIDHVEPNTARAMSRMKKIELRLQWDSKANPLESSPSDWPYAMFGWLEDIIRLLQWEAGYLNSITLSVVDMSEGMTWECKEKLLVPLKVMRGRVVFHLGEVVAAEKEEELRERLNIYLEGLNG